MLLCELAGQRAGNRLFDLGKGPVIAGLSEDRVQGKSKCLRTVRRTGLAGIHQLPTRG
jgi:hypothetical protein